jgi:hypothetical protein
MMINARTPPPMYIALSSFRSMNAGRDVMYPDSAPLTPSRCLHRRAGRRSQGRQARVAPDSATEHGQATRAQHPAVERRQPRAKAGFAGREPGAASGPMLASTRWGAARKGRKPASRRTVQQSTDKRRGRSIPPSSGVSLGRRPASPAGSPGRPACRCGREDSNLQGPCDPTGPKPAASTSSATPALIKDRA